MQRTKLKAPFGWVGGKTQLARDIIDLIPQDHKTYIEVFGGAGSVLYQKEPSKLEVFNDINSELINLHRAIRNNPQNLSMYLNDLFISREIFNDIKKRKLKTTTKLYHINQYNENILFFMCKNLNQLDWETPDDFLNGKNLVDFIKKHPKFNIHQTNKLGRNLLFECLLNSVFPEKLVSFLIESNVDYTIKDKDGYNVLNLFSLMNFNQSSSKCFLKFTEKNDITNKNKFNDTCISNWLSFIKSDKHNQRNKTYYNWLNFTFENIQNEQISVNNKDYLINLLSEYTEIESPLLLSTIGFLKYKKLDEKLSSNTKKEKKIKL